MKKDYIADKTFKNIDGKKTTLHKAGYENCRFMHCNLSNFNLTEYRFINCKFETCDLSLANLSLTTFRDAEFRDCKMLEMQFDNCNDFGLAFSFDNCILDHSSFYKTKICKTIFRRSQLHEADFTECDLTGSVFDDCSLARAIFHKTNLEKCDLRNSRNYSIDPENNRIRKAKFAYPGVAGLLDKYDILLDGKD